VVEVKIVVNDIAASEGGALSILRDFYDEIISSGDQNQWVFLLGDHYLDSRENIEIIIFPDIKKSWLKRLKFDFFSGKKLINELKPDLYFSLQNTATLGVHCSQVVYLHQPLPYQKEKKYSFFRRKEVKYAVYQKIIGKIYTFLLKKSQANVIVQSEWMRENVRHTVPNEIKVIVPKIVEDINTVPKFSLDRYKNQKEKFFFYPSGYYPYKNQEILFNAVEKLHNDGIVNFSVSLTIDKKIIQNRHFPPNIKFLGNIDRQHVFELYSQSVLLFPSYIETFGLPLLEAKILNCPIITAETEFSREILRGYPNAIYFDKDDPNHLKMIMEAVIKNDFSLTKSISERNSNEITIFNYLVGEVENNDKKHL
jgi:glycosyltransferase involved in cell wall biosynthesis